MKQTKLREPILYTSLWVVSSVLFILGGIYGPFSLDIFGDILGMIMLLLTMLIAAYALMGWIIVLTKRSDRNDTRDMKKYILGKIKDIDEKIEELREKKEELLLSIKD